MLCKIYFITENDMIYIDVLESCWYDNNSEEFFIFTKDCNYNLSAKCGKERANKLLYDILRVNTYYAITDLKFRFNV